MGCVESTDEKNNPKMNSKYGESKDGVVTLSYEKQRRSSKQSRSKQQKLNGSLKSHVSETVTKKKMSTNLDKGLKNEKSENGYMIKTQDMKEKHNFHKHDIISETIAQFKNKTIGHTKGQYDINCFPEWGLYKMFHTCSIYQNDSLWNKRNDHCFYNGDGQFVPQRRGSCGVHVSSTVNNKRYIGDYCQGSQGYVCDCRLTNILAMNALDLTAPASDALLKNRKNAWVQLAGHPGAFAPAGPHTIWKKRLSKENTETVVYQHLMNDIVKDLVPKFYREVEYNGDFFIEMQDLIQHFTDPNILDIKMGTRTFQESEVKNAVLRKDLYEKMIKLNTNEPTAEEHEQKAITKLRYMQFRERGSSTASLGFRCEAIRMSGQKPITSLQKVKTKQEIHKTLATFLQGNEVVKEAIIKRLKDIRRKFESSQFFKSHEIIGSSLLFLYDKDNRAGVWMIDFAKTILVEDHTLTHRDTWQVGNHEDGYLYGIDNLIQVFETLDFSNEDNSNPPSSIINTTEQTESSENKNLSTENVLVEKQSQVESEVKLKVDATCDG